MNGPELREWRKLLGYTQEAAANELEVTRATIQNWEYGITAVPVAVALACRQLLRRWKQRPDFGPVTLTYASAPLWPTPNGVDRLPTLTCRRCSDNYASFLTILELRNSPDFFDPLILDQTNNVIWSGPLLMEACDKLFQAGLAPRKNQNSQQASQTSCTEDLRAIAEQARLDPSKG